MVWLSLGDAHRPLEAGKSYLVPAGVFHRMWTERDEMQTVALALQLVPGPEWVRVENRAALALNAAQRFVLIARAAIAEHGQFCVALSGGSTPRDLFSALIQPEFARQVAWEHVHLFWGDERAVPRDHPESNYRMAFEILGDCQFQNGRCTAYQQSWDRKARQNLMSRCCGRCFRQGIAPGPVSISYCWAWARTDTRRRCSPLARARGDESLGRLGLCAGSQDAPHYTHRSGTQLSREHSFSRRRAGQGEHRSGGAARCVASAGSAAQLVHLEYGHLIWLLDRSAASQL